MQILVDADAFPRQAKEILFRAVQKRRLPLIMIANQYLRVPLSPYISSQVVESGPDEADDRIVELTRPGDLVVTADIPLAARIVDQGGLALDPRGQLYTEDNVKERLATRDLMDQLRQGGLELGGPPAYDRRDVQAFADQLNRLLSQHGPQAV